MKVASEKQKFIPISITLESQNEVDWLYHVTRFISGSGEAREFFDGMRNSLKNYRDGLVSVNGFSGDIDVSL